MKKNPFKFMTALVLSLFFIGASTASFANQDFVSSTNKAYKQSLTQKHNAQVYTPNANDF